MESASGKKLWYINLDYKIYGSEWFERLQCSGANLVFIFIATF